MKTSLQTTPSPIRAKVLCSPSRRTWTSPLALHKAKVAPQSHRSLTPTSLWNSVKIGSWPNRKGSAVSTKTFVSSVVLLAIWLRTAWNVLKPKLVLQNSPRNQLQHLRPQPQTRKRTNQSSRLCMTQGLRWTPLCENSHPQHIRSFEPQLSNTLVNIWLNTKLSLHVPCGLQRSSNSFINSAFIQTNHLLTTWIPLMTLPYGWNFKFCHHPGSWFAYLCSYWGNSDIVILCHSIGPRLHDCARIPLAHPLQSYDRLGIGPHLFPPTVAAGSQDVTSRWDFSVVGASVKSGNHQPGNFRTFSAGKRERERENQLTCLKREALMVHGRNYIKKTKSNTIMAKQHCDREAALRQAGAGWQTAGRGENESP